MSSSIAETALTENSLLMLFKISVGMKELQILILSFNDKVISYFCLKFWLHWHQLSIRCLQIREHLLLPLA